MISIRKTRDGRIGQEERFRQTTRQTNANEDPSVNVIFNDSTQPEGGWPADDGADGGADDEARVEQEAGDQDDKVLKESRQRVSSYRFYEIIALTC